MILAVYDEEKHLIVAHRDYQKQKKEETEMSEEEEVIVICPRCYCRYVGHPSLSRRDNATYICVPCGTDEAINDATPIDQIGILRLAMEMKFMEKIGKNYAEWYVWKKKIEKEEKEMKLKNEE